MAASITTQADVLTYAAISDNEIKRLSTARMESDNWATLHQQGWTLVKKYLRDRRPTIEEADLDDTDELKEVTVYAVLYLAYQAADFLSDEDKRRAKYWWKKFRREFSTVIVTVDGVEKPPELFANLRSIRG